jgi:hypothetical protein
VWTKNLQLNRPSVDPDRWEQGLHELMGRVAGRFARVEPRRHARAFVLGLLAGLPRSNCWSIAEHAGASTPDAMRHLLSRASWDHDGVVDDLRAYVVEHLGERDGVLVVDLCRPGNYADVVSGVDANAAREVGFSPARLAERSA